MKSEERANRDILIVFPELPYPARLNGVSIRYAPIIEDISQRFSLDIAVILRPAMERLPEFDLVKAFCGDVFVLHRQIKSLPLYKKLLIRFAKLFPLGTPYYAYCNDLDEIRNFLRDIDAKRKYSRIVWVTANYLDAGMEVFDANTICLDAIDSSYSHIVRNSHESGSSALDVWHTKKWEEYLIKRTRVTTYVSQLDAKVFQSNSELAGKVHVVPNGIYLGDVEPLQDSAITSTNTLTLGFLGNMGYAPNINAVLRLKQIYDRACRQNPLLKLRIIGRNPVDEILAMHDGKDIVVTGTVPSIWSEIQKVDVFVFPMVSGAGQQNKLLEAMFAGKPVICNALANSGIGGIHAKHLMICDSDESFVDAILELSRQASQREMLGSSAQAYVGSTFSWSAIIPQLENLWFYPSSSEAARRL
jgi:glycosyltransferase involved in cell wall biosynthesis